jgi:DNA-binding transcriptional ArsR family regulator
VHAFDVLGDPVRRRLLELLGDDERPAGEVTGIVVEEFGITQPAVSRQLRILRENGFATVRAEGTRRLYSVDPDGFGAARDWLDRMDRYWGTKLDALGTEITRQNRAARRGEGANPTRQNRAARRGEGADPTRQNRAAAKGTRHD